MELWIGKVTILGADVEHTIVIGDGDPILFLFRHYNPLIKEMIEKLIVLPKNIAVSRNQYFFLCYEIKRQIDEINEEVSNDHRFCELYAVKFSTPFIGRREKIS